MKRRCLTLLLALVVSLIPARDAAALANRTNPVLFIYGLNEDPDIWGDVTQLLDASGWRFGGIPRSTDTLEPVFDARFGPGIGISAGDYYVLEFSDNKILTLEQQGQQLGIIIDAILAVNPGRAKVSLVGHGMGGLAARYYLQYIGAAVDSLITVGTPHQGTEIAVVCQELSPACEELRVSGTVAETELRPDSPTLLSLNDLITHPLPNTVTYTSIVSTGGPTLILQSDGDGVVPETSQNLGLVAGTSNLQHRSETFLGQPCFFRWTSFLEIHTCETWDFWIIGSIFAALGVTVDLDIKKNHALCESSCVLTAGDSIEFLLVNQEPQTIFGDVYIFLKGVDRKVVGWITPNAALNGGFTVGGGQIPNTAEPGFYSALIIVTSPGESADYFLNWRHLGSASFKIESP